MALQSDIKTITVDAVKSRAEHANRLVAGGRYLIKGTPRFGGIAQVFKAFDAHEECFVALKIFRAGAATDAVVEESFRRETQALSDLKHPNIVKILDSGFDEESSEHYIAMEWVEVDLANLLARKPFNDWDAFFLSFGRSILEALAFAHAHATVHRDIKPSNILVTPEGIAKVCDFGISKIRGFLEPGVTLSHFATFPFAPPEHDDGSHSYSRDVFGFAALSVVALTPSKIDTHQNLIIYLEQLSVTDPLKQLLRRCLSLDKPGDRPINAAVLLAEFDRLIPRKPVEKKGRILLSLTNKVKQIVEYDLALKSDGEIQRFIENDLNSALCVSDLRQAPDNSTQVGPTIRLIGARYRYIAVSPSPLGEKLLLVSALEQLSSDTERNRDDALPAAYDFCFEGVLPSGSGQQIKALQEELSEFGADQKVKIVEQRKLAIYRTWLDFLSAKTELERRRKKGFAYSEYESSGSVVRFKLATTVPLTSLDEQDVQVLTASGDIFTGSVISVSEAAIVVQPSDRNRVEIASLPDSGVLTIDTSKSDLALEKQKSALDAVRFGRTVNPVLGDYIVEPSTIPVPAVADIDFIEQNIDDDKKDAVRTALSEPDVMLVQGPPGTGKTTFITEVVLQTLMRNPEARILLTSQTHVALDNSLERILKQSKNAVRAIRIGHENDERIPETTKSLLIERKLPAMRKEALAKGKAFIESWVRQKGLDLISTRIAMALERHAGLKNRLELIEEQVLSIDDVITSNKKTMDREARADLEEQQSELIREQDALIRDMKESIADLREYETDKETLEHFSECSSNELRSWADSYASDSIEGNQLRKLLSVHTEWEVRFGRSSQFKAALVTQSQVIAGTCLGVMAIPGRNDITYDLCIVDEASIATPTEVLVPMSRARRTILVGDDKQLSPFSDPELKSSGLLQQYSLSEEDQKATLFNHLKDQLPIELTKVLTTQHRMLPAIGNLISACFYDTKLNSIPRSQSVLLNRTLPRAVTWFSTSACLNKGSKAAGTSQWNGLEVRQVSDILARADFEIKHGKLKDSKFSVAVLTGYGEQRERLHAAIQTKRHEWSSFSDIYVNVVDAFQGREADIVIFSVTRSDVRGLGFLREMERINVALSRAKHYLVIVGDHVFCQEAEGRINPLRQVIEYIQGNPLDCALEEIKQ